MWGWFSQSPWGGHGLGGTACSNDSQDDDIEMSERSEQSPATGIQEGRKGMGAYSVGENGKTRAAKRRRDEPSAKRRASALSAVRGTREQLCVSTSRACA